MSPDIIQGNTVFGILCFGLKLSIFQIPWCESVFGSFRSPSPIINITMKMIIMEGQQWNVKHVRKDGKKGIIYLLYWVI